jgi:chromosome segregation ATPase
MPAYMQQVPTPPTPPPVPVPGAAAPAPATITLNGTVYRVPSTSEEVQALRNQRSELSNQLNSAARRREGLANDLEGKTGADRAGIESRIKVLDERIVQIEQDIANTGQVLALARGTVLAPEPPENPDNPMQIDVTAITAILSVFVLGPLAIVYARNLWKRGSAEKVETQLERQNAERLARLESAVDAIAIEMERVSEGQRFVTKLLAESQGREKARIEAPRV